MDGHRVPYGKLEDKYEAAFSLFLSSSLEGCCDTVQEPKNKTLSERFKKIGAEHRMAVKANVAASGITELRGEKEVALDDIVLELEDWAEQRKTEREEKAEIDKRLQGVRVQM